MIVHALFGQVGQSIIQALLYHAVMYTGNICRAVYHIASQVPADSIVGAVPKAVIHYSILNCYINALAPGGDMKKADGRTATLIGMLTGATEVLLVNPINFVKFRMQRPEWGYSGMVDAVRTIYRTEGARAFWKGTGAVFLRNSICNGGMVGGYKITEKALANSELDIPDGPRHFLAGAVGGVVGSFLSYPFEMLRAAQTHNISFTEEIVAKGPQRILAGWAPGAARLVVTAAIMGSIIPHLKDFSNSLVMAKDDPADGGPKAELKDEHPNGLKGCSQPMKLQGFPRGTCRICLGMYNLEPRWKV
eukprot:CAMPEP_0117657758 /NCGR_PEP_ID=MMETSP0804-20121206/5499_1 /TAXON_ID=1074897 /ORGANISM="Tetraselmis astigmatica, Strain CCMP880" /LENGTH=304 /DNA_ID=CAMNT_0005464229 /DNA_START=415 /DNA_END=1331 /DNA_ORIENTATION=-